MEQRNESISEVLLSRLPQLANLPAYQQEMEALLAKNDETLRKSKSTVKRLWIFVVAVALPFLWMGGTHFNTPQGNLFLGLTCFWVLLGAVEVEKYQAQKDKTDLLKEIKQTQLQILQLYSAIAAGNTKKD